MSVMPKGISHEMTLYDIGGIIDRDAAAHLPEKVDGVLTEMTPPLSIRIMQLTEKHGTESVSGVILRAGRRDMHIRADQPCDDFSNIRISLTGISSQNSDASFYAKVTGQLDDQSGPAFQAHATSISGDLSARLRQLAEKAAGNRS
jgi:hypothetical protein